MKWIITIAILILTTTTYAQTLTQVFVDPCSGKVTTVVVPLAGGKTTIVYRGQYKVVTANDITSGTLQAWINELTVNYPCPQATIAVTQTVANAVSQAVAAATTAATATATAAATSAATTAATSAAAPAPVAETKTETPAATTTESKSETKTESKSEEKSESKSESKSSKKTENKAKSSSSNPIIYSSDFTVAPSSEVISIIASVGMSQASLMGNSSWGINSMIWSTFDQFALGGRYTMMNFNEGKLESISNFGVTGVYLSGNVLGFGTAAYILPMGKYGTTGANYTLSIAGADEEINVSNNIMLFYTVPIKINRYVSISPDVYVSGSSTGYLTKQKVFVTSNDIGFLTGASFDIALTKRFKFNFALKTGVNTNPAIPQSYLGMIGTKINL
jgi:hypothetical protein